MIKKILVCLDGSEHSSTATSYAIWLAGKMGATLTGIHVIDVVALEGPFFHDISASIGFEPFMSFSTRMREALESKGKTLLSTFEEASTEASIRHEVVLSTGVVTNEICDKARLSDLVIVGRRGVNEEFEKALLGSTTEGVVRKSAKPVLVTPREFAPPANPLLVYDGSPTAAGAMHWAAELSKTLDLPLTVATVAKTPEEEKRLVEAEDYLKPYGVRARFVSLKGDPPSAIEKYYGENGHDLLFVGKTHHSRFVELVLGSTTEHLMRATRGPLFIAG